MDSTSESGIPESAGRERKKHRKRRSKEILEQRSPMKKPRRNRGETQRGTMQRNLIQESSRDKNQRTKEVSKVKISCKRRGIYALIPVWVRKGSQWEQEDVHNRFRLATRTMPCQGADTTTYLDETLATGPTTVASVASCRCSTLLPSSSDSSSSSSSSLGG